ncbi:FIST N-terminal domain-containing protein [Sagittula salina]|uniref:FIST C-terminal domain-containing protein n=1 Tax=Sagittula salina TaxID=2820268 RepID=A0A940RZK8_9RHOB|nr:FIST N-terminal domain-containing protein [Sagittula salina]MBP0482088.1 FIST C-terminal domain-containing protein [Sagittula salina]
MGGPRGLRRAQVACIAPDAVGSLARALGNDLSLVCLFASPDTDFERLTAEAARSFGAADVLACTTAGELGEQGYEEGQIIGVGFPRALFEVLALAIEDLDRINEQSLIDELIHHRLNLTRRAPEMTSEFAFTLVDGLSLREEHLTAVLASGLGPIPVFGGSSGDGTEFGRTLLSFNGRVMQNAALVAILRSHCAVRVFSLDHLVPTEVRMVVTSACPERRIVQEINAEPAAQEYARLLGKDPMQLDPFTFAAHPVVVRLGDTHHVRAIQRVAGNGSDLVFFSAINEGMVLTLASHRDMAAHLESGLAALAEGGAPAHILGFDCLLRRIEAEQVQKTQALSEILQRHNVVGFSTYGEQIGALHVNQTLTGVAIYPPDRDL